MHSFRQSAKPSQPILVVLGKNWKIQHQRRWKFLTQPALEVSISVSRCRKASCKAFGWTEQPKSSCEATSTCMKRRSQRKGNQNGICKYPLNEFAHIPPWAFSFLVNKQLLDAEFLQSHAPPAQGRAPIISIREISDMNTYREGSFCKATCRLLWKRLWRLLRIRNVEADRDSDACAKPFRHRTDKRAL